MSLGTGSMSGVSIVHDAHGRAIPFGFPASEPVENVSKFVGGTKEAEAWIAAMKGPLNFLGNLKATPLRDHFGAVLDVPTKTPGAYILVARDGIEFKYPRGESPVYYIGKAGGPGHGLRNRIRTHRNNIRDARNNRKFCFHGPVAEYGAAFGEWFSYVRSEDAGMEPAELEIELMTRFAKRYGTHPVANSSAEREKIRKVIELCGTNTQA